MNRNQNHPHIVTNLRSTASLYEEMQMWWVILSENHIKYVEKDSKEAAIRARQTALKIKKLAIQYRESSVEETRIKHRDWPASLVEALSG